MMARRPARFRIEFEYETANTAGVPYIAHWSYGAARNDLRIRSLDDARTVASAKLADIVGSNIKCAIWQGPILREVIQ